MKSLSNFALLAIAAAVLSPSGASAQTNPKPGYLLDSAGGFVWSGTPGQCWHTSEWTPALALEPCDPVMRKVAIAAVADPAPKAPEPAPAPVAARVVPAVIAPVGHPKVSFSADAMFAFDKSELKPEGKTMLQDLARQLGTTDYVKVVLTGHADHIGGTQYNQALSEQRAAEVKRYLVDQGIATDRIEASGVGETAPETSSDDCVGAKGAKLIACLQPDRRVDVEMNGTRK